MADYQNKKTDFFKIVTFTIELETTIATVAYAQHVSHLYKWPPQDTDRTVFAL